MTTNTAYRTAVAVAVGAALVLVWLMGAVGTRRSSARCSRSWV